MKKPKQPVDAARQVQMWHVDQLVPYGRNARTHTDQQIAQVAASMREFGWTNPILVDGKGVIIAGHARLEAAKKLGIVEVPVIVLGHLTETQCRALVLADNKLATNAGWDDEMLHDELAALQEESFALDLLGFSAEELDSLLSGPEEENAGLTDADSVPDAQERVVTVPGDLWIMGGHRLLCGDCAEIPAVERLMDGEKAGMVITDPPYGMRLDADWSGCIGSIGRERGTQGNKYAPVIGDSEDYNPVSLMEYFRSVPEQFWFGADYYAERIANKNKGSWLVWDKRKESQAEAIGSEFELLWSKAKHKRRVLRHDWFGFLSSANAKEAQHRVHPTQKPTSLIVDLMNQWGRTLDNIVDPYLGSGTTLIAAEKTGRRCYGMELAPQYVDVIVRRWEAFTGREAVLDGVGRTFAAIAADRCQVAA